MPTHEGGISASEAARRLGVKRETVYAYVSRGLLTSWRSGDRRQSLFDPVEVSRLASRQSRGGRSGGFELVIDSSITLLEPSGELFFRGWDVTKAARTAWYEEVALWLWGVDESDPASLFQAPEPLLGRARAAVQALEAPSLLDSYLVAITAAASADPYRFGRDLRATARRAAGIVALLVESLPGASPGHRPAASVARRLWGRLSGREPTSEEEEALNAALVLLADHELATSTLGARLAASTWADIYRVVAAGLAVAGGPLHASAGDQVVKFIRSALEDGIEATVGQFLERGQLVPGFGHVLYESRDPRFEVLFDAIAAAWPESQVLTTLGELVEVVLREESASFPNIDLALGALVLGADMRTGAAEAIFSLARSAGWIAHGLEEYGHRLRYRGRAVYTGPEAGSSEPVLSGEDG
jgi:citrate synthase